MSKFKQPDMKNLSKLILAFSVTLFFNCEKSDDGYDETLDTSVNFSYRASIKIGGAAASEITAYDTATRKLFTVNVESNEISVTNISDLNLLVKETAIDLKAHGTPNSVSVYDGLLAVAVEANPKQNPGKVLLFNASNNSLIREFTVGALPDMVTFSKDGNLLVTANEGEPNDDYTVDPNGSVSIIDLTDNSVVTLDFTAFNAMEASLKAEGFRVYGPGATLAQDVEPEYVTISDDSKFAWVSLQENNAIAKIDLQAKVIQSINSLGFKDYSLPGNEIDASDKDDVTELKSWPVYGIYQPDAIKYASIGGVEYIFSANEGDSRDYDGYSEEERVKDLVLDETVFSSSLNYQDDDKLGRLKVTTSLGDADTDGKYEKLYSYGARSFSIWSTNGGLLYDSGNSISREVLANTPQKFNWDWEDSEADKRSDDKGGEPEAVEILNLGNQRYVLFVGLERNSQVLVYDITNPMSPKFLQILQHEGDLAPEGLLVIPSENSPNGKDLLVVSNEDSGTITIYQNN